MIPASVTVVEDENSKVYTGREQNPSLDYVKTQSLPTNKKFPHTPKSRKIWPIQKKKEKIINTYRP